MAMPQRNMDRMGSEDVSVPVIMVVQKTTSSEVLVSGATYGDFYNRITQQVFPGKEGFDLVVVDVRKLRTYWGRSEIFDEPPECASMDADSMKSIDGQDCKKCEHLCDTPWAFPADKRRGMCLTSYNILGINYEDQMPFIMRASGISAGSVKDLMSILKFNRPLKGQYHRALIHAYTVVRKSPSGEAYAIAFKMKAILPETEPKTVELALQSAQMLGVNVLPEGREPDAFDSEGRPLFGEEAVRTAKEQAKGAAKAEAKVAETVKEIAGKLPKVDMNF